MFDNFFRHVIFCNTINFYHLTVFLWNSIHYFISPISLYYSIKIAEFTQIEKLIKQNMDLSRVTKFDDNSLFRFFSKSYSKNRSKNYLNQLPNTSNLSGTQKLNRYDNKLRSQSTSLCNTFSKSLSITQSYPISRPGFLKYRNYSKNESVPLNSSIQMPKKSLHHLNISLKAMDERNFSEFKKSVSVFETTQKASQQFGLRNLVKRVKNDFRYQGDRLRKKQVNGESLEYDILCEDSKKTFMGQKTYNLNSFLITDNGKGLYKRGKEGIKTSIMKRKLRKGGDREMRATMG